MIWFIWNRVFNLQEEQMDYETKCDVCVGQNQELEKEYLRLTGPPEPHMIRPEHVLKKSLVFVLNKYAETSNYRYICEQLKSIRQDLTVNILFIIHSSESLLFWPI